METIFGVLGILIYGIMAIAPEDAEGRKLEEVCGNCPTPFYEGQGRYRVQGKTLCEKCWREWKDKQTEENGYDELSA